jgi:hypothetical protein
MPVTAPPVIQPDGSLFGIRIAEPVTSATALMVSAVCWYAWRRLRPRAPANEVVWLARGFFLLLGLATLLGGLIGHAFQYRLTFAWKVPGWVLSMSGIVALERAAIVHARPLMAPAWGQVFTVLNVLEFAIVLCLALWTLDFRVVEIHAAYGLLIVVGLFEGYVFVKTRDAGSRAILGAVLVAAVAALVHGARLSLSVWFTFFDIGHVLMCAGVLLLMRGVERMAFHGNGCHAVRPPRIRPNPVESTKVTGPPWGTGETRETAAKGHCSENPAPGPCGDGWRDGCAPG